MTFETLATEELFSVAKRLADAADERIRTAALAAADAARAEVEQSLTALRAESAQELASARAEAETAIAALQARLGDALAEAERGINQARADADARLAEARAQDGGAAERLLEESAFELSRVRDDAQAALQQTHDAHAAELAAVKADANRQAAAARDTAQAELAALRAAAEQEISTLRAAAESAAKTNAAYGGMIDRLRNEHTRLAGEAERLAAENAALTYERADVLEKAQASQRGPMLSKLRRTIRAVADATSTDDVLAAASAAIGDDAPGMSFTLHEQGVVCVDAQGRPVTEAVGDDAVNMIELMRAHVTLRLDRLAIEQKAAAELRAYAQMLVDEIEYVYEADAGSARPEAARLEKLGENVRCARQIFQQRVTVEGPANSRLLEEVLERICERKSAQPFGKDLAATLSRSLNPRSVAHAS